MDALEELRAVVEAVRVLLLVRGVVERALPGIGVVDVVGRRVVEPGQVAAPAVA